MNSLLENRAVQFSGGCLTALVAALVAIWLFNVTTPPRDLSLLLTPNPTPPELRTVFPTPTLALPTNTPRPPTATPVPPTRTPTPLPPTPALVMSDNFATPGNWPTGATSVYSQTRYLLRPRANTDFLLAPFKTFHDKTGHDLSIQAAAAPGNPTGPIEYGVFFWHSGTAARGERFIAFAVDLNGGYHLQAFVPVSPTGSPLQYRSVDLVLPTRALDIQTDGRLNQLRVDVHPHQVFAFVNNKLVIQLDDVAIDAYRNRSDFDGSVGLFAAATGSANGQVSFSRFALYADATP